MNHVNHVELVGNLGSDPKVLKETKTGLFVGLQMAANKEFIAADGAVKKFTHWQKVRVNGSLGKYVATYFKKGDKILVSGELCTEKYAKNDKIYHGTVIHAKECKLLFSKQWLNESASAKTAAAPAAVAANHSNPAALAAPLADAMDDVMYTDMEEMPFDEFE